MTNPQMAAQNGVEGLFLSRNTREVLLQYRRFLAPIVSTLNWFLHQYLNFAPSAHFVLASS